MLTEETIAARGPASVSDAYRKAQKTYVLFSGLLAAWELIGITLDTKERWGIELKSPAGVPLILIVLVFYSGYKVGIEWIQCDPAARLNRAAKWDFVVTHLIAFGAIGIAIVQFAFRVQIVTAILTGGLIPGSRDVGLVLILLFLGFCAPIAVRLKRKGYGQVTAMASGFLIVVTIFHGILVIHYHGIRRLLIDLSIGIPLSTALAIWLWSLPTDHKEQSGTPT